MGVGPRSAAVDKATLAKATYKPATKLKNAWGRSNEDRLASELGVKVDTDNDTTCAPTRIRDVTNFGHELRGR